MTGTDDNDAYLSNDTARGSQYAGNVIDTSPTSTIPLAGSVAGAYTGVTHGDWSSLFAAAGDLTGNAISFVADPLNWLISAGLSFVIDFFQPLEDLLSLFTGNAERIQPYADKWKELGAALVPLGEATKQAATDHLINWKGQDADAATARLTEFGEAIKATGTEANAISVLLSLFAKIMATAQQIITSIIATLVEWFIVEWAAAMAAAGPTMGGSVAAATAASGVQAAVATSRAVRIVDKVVSLLQQIGRLLAKVLPSVLEERVSENVARIGASATLSTVARIGGSVVTDWRTYPGPTTGAGSGLWSDLAAKGPSMSDKQIDEALDPDK